MKKLTGYLWYSEGQKRAAQEVAQSPIGLPAGCLPVPYEPPVGRLKDGRLVNYTELLPPGEVSLWADAVCLGEGEYAGK